MSTVDPDQPYCYVTTAGRVTGRDHEIEIWFAGGEESIYLISGGQERSDWVRNLQATPPRRCAWETRRPRSPPASPRAVGARGKERRAAIDALYDKYGDQVTTSRPGWHRDAFHRRPRPPGRPNGLTYRRVAWTACGSGSPASATSPCSMSPGTWTIRSATWSALCDPNVDKARARADGVGRRDRARLAGRPAGRRAGGRGRDPHADVHARRPCGGRRRGGQARLGAETDRQHGG